MAVVPSVWPKLLKPGLKKDKEFAHLRYVTTAGGFHPPELLKNVANFFTNTEIIVMYGLTESFRSTYLPFSEMFKRPGSIGKAVPEVEILVLNEQGERCQPGEKGELVHRGAFVTYGYLNNPELNEKKFLRLNMFDKTCLPEFAVRSGDQVSTDADGFIYFHGRMDMQIKSSGYRISPDEVAQAVLATPGIAQAVVFGLPDDVLGEAIHVAYETYDGKKIETIEIKRHAKTSLASYAIPHHYHFYERIKLNPNGKIDFAFLKREALASIAPRADRGNAVE
jgi:acyl-coenzyme A synthetase/AMP-(fatty) acid ligase